MAAATVAKGIGRCGGKAGNKLYKAGVCLSNKTCKPASRHTAAVGKYCNYLANMLTKVSRWLFAAIVFSLKSFT